MRQDVTNAITAARQQCFKTVPELEETENKRSLEQLLWQ